MGDLDNQRCGELGDAVPRKEDAGIADGDASGQVHCICDGLLEEGGVRGEGRAETGTRFIKRESEVGAGRKASWVLFSGVMCC